MDADDPRREAAPILSGSEAELIREVSRLWAQEEGESWCGRSRGLVRKAKSVLMVITAVDMDCERERFVQEVQARGVRDSTRVREWIGWWVLRAAAAADGVLSVKTGKCMVDALRRRAANGADGARVQAGTKARALVGKQSPSRNNFGHSQSMGTYHLPLTTVVCGREQLVGGADIGRLPVVGVKDLPPLVVPREVPELEEEFLLRETLAAPWGLPRLVGLMMRTEKIFGRGSAFRLPGAPEVVEQVVQELGGVAFIGQVKYERWVARGEEAAVWREELAHPVLPTFTCGTACAVLQISTNADETGVITSEVVLTSAHQRASLCGVPLDVLHPLRVAVSSVEDGQGRKMVGEGDDLDVAADVWRAADEKLRMKGVDGPVTQGELFAGIGTLAAGQLAAVGAERFSFAWAAELQEETAGALAAGWKGRLGAVLDALAALGRGV